MVRRIHILLISISNDSASTRGSIYTTYPLPSARVIIEYITPPAKSDSSIGIINQDNTVSSMACLLKKHPPRTNVDCMNMSKVKTYRKLNKSGKDVSK